MKKDVAGELIDPESEKRSRAVELAASYRRMEAKLPMGLWGHFPWVKPWKEPASTPVAEKTAREQDEEVMQARQSLPEGARRKEIHDRILRRQEVAKKFFDKDWGDFRILDFANVVTSVWLEVQCRHCKHQTKRAAFTLTESCKCPTLVCQKRAAGETESRGSVDVTR